MRLSTITLLLIRFKIGNNDKKKTLKYVLPTTVCFIRNVIAILVCIQFVWNTLACPRPIVLEGNLLVEACSP